MHLGALNRKIEIQALSINQNQTTGAIENTWEEFCSPWASVVFSSGDEDVAAKAETVFKKVVFTVRWSQTTASVTEKMRVLFEDAYYEIVSAIPADGRRDWITISCSRIY